jgi:hypothetical protein
MRERWDRTANWALVRCGPHASQTGAHAHADALALELSLAGHTVLIDPGTYCYTASRADREYFRGSAAHNTVTLDERSSAEPGESVFNWQSVPQSRATAWVTKPMFDFFKGEHDGFRRLAPPAMHSRAVFLLKGEYCVVHDRIRSVGAHRIALWLHWAPGSTVSRENQNILNVQLAEPNAPRITAIIHARGGDLSREEGWVSPAYAVRAPAPVSVLRLDASGSEDIVTVIASSASCQRLRQSALRAGSGINADVLTLELDASVDTILTGPTSDSRHNEIVSDAAWTWVRCSPSGELLAFALVGGSALTIGGCRLFHSDSIVDCAIGRRDSDGWRIELASSDRASIVSTLSTASGIEESCAASVE